MISICLKAVVLCQTWIASQQEENFKSASEFIPERWLDPNPEARAKSFLVAPFGVGKRMCPGKRFVHLELQVVLAQVSVHLFI